MILKLIITIVLGTLVPTSMHMQDMHTGMHTRVPGTREPGTGTIVQALYSFCTGCLNMHMHTGMPDVAIQFGDEI